MLFNKFKIDLQLFAGETLEQLLGEELYKQVTEKLGDQKIAIVSDGNWIPKDKFNALNEQLKTANNTIDDLKKSNKDNEALQTKVGEYETKVKDYEKQIQDMQFNYALEGALKGANARNIKAIKALLDLDKVSIDGDNLIGLEEQLKGLKESDSYLFGADTLNGREPNKDTNTIDPSMKNNPWKKETFNLTDQGKIFKENPEQARQLMSQAGVNI